MFGNATMNDLLGERWHVNRSHLQSCPWTSITSQMKSLAATAGRRRRSHGYSDGTENSW
jgi:hypothetical protein